MAEGTITRRESLALAGIAAGAAAMPVRGATPPEPPLVTRIDFKDPKWNRDTYIRMDADVDPTKEKCGWLKGTAFGVRDNEKVRPLFKMEGFSFVRVKRLDDGSWRRLLREVVFYRDLDTDKILETWRNPYTNEDVKVVPIANDPFNFTIGEFWPDPPSYGGLNAEKPPKRPYLLDWANGPNGTLILNTDINLFYPSAMQPAEWPRESAGRVHPRERALHLCREARRRGESTTDQPAGRRLVDADHAVAAVDADGRGAGAHHLFQHLRDAARRPLRAAARPRRGGARRSVRSSCRRRPRITVRRCRASRITSASTSRRRCPPGWTPPQPPPPPRVPATKG